MWRWCLPPETKLEPGSTGWCLTMKSFVGEKDNAEKLKQERCDLFSWFLSEHMLQHSGSAEESLWTFSSSLIIKNCSNPA